MNLKKDQRRYRVFVEDGATGLGDDAWRYYELHGKYGKMWPYSQDTLALYVTSNILMNRIRREYKWPIKQQGDFETVFLVPDKQFDIASQLLRFKKRRQLSQETKQRLISRLASLRAKHATGQG